MRHKLLKIVTTTRKRPIRRSYNTIPFDSVIVYARSGYRLRIHKHRVEQVTDILLVMLLFDKAVSQMVDVSQPAVKLRSTFRSHLDKKKNPHVQGPHTKV